MHMHMHMHMNTNDSSPISTTRLYEIDLLRFFAAMAVVFCHYTFVGYTTIEDFDIQFTFLHEYTRYGYLGVDLFFLISGFVILMSASNSTAGTFFIGRFTRIYPTFVVAVTLTAMLRMSFGPGDLGLEPEAYLYNLTLVAGFFEDSFDLELVDTVYWSLQVELKFYALIWVLLLTRSMRHIEAFLASWLLISIGALFIELPEWIDNLAFPEWSPYFIAGAIFYLIRQRGFNLFRGIVITTCYFLSLNNAYELQPFLEEIYNDSLSPEPAWLLVTVFYLAFVALATDLSRVIRSRLWMGAGALS